jgi:hypothetical protein
MLGTRLQECLALGYYGWQFVSRVLRRSAPLDRSAYWRQLSVSPDPATADPLDLPTLFFTRLAAGYASVAELGAGNGRRIIAIKQALPQVKAFGFDLAEAYDPPRAVAGVDFARYSLERLRGVPDGTLVVCVGTLVCCQPAELMELLGLLRSKRMALAYFEPAPVFRTSQSFRRRVSSGHYHHYETDLRRAGFNSRLNGKWPYLGSPELEKWTYDYVVPADSAPPKT